MVGIVAALILVGLSLTVTRVGAAALEATGVSAALAHFHDLPAEGVLVLGVRTVDGDFVGAPGADTVIDPGDTVLLYGREDVLGELRDRPRGSTGDAEHREGTKRQDRVAADERSRRERSRHDEA